MELNDFMQLYSTGVFHQKYLDSGGNGGSAITALIVDRRSTLTAPVSTLVRGVCHACVKNSSALSSADYIITAVAPELANRPGAQLYFDWLVNRSCVRDAFVVKDPALIVRYGFVVKPDYDGASWLVAVQLARMSTNEYKYSFEAVHQLLADGYAVHPLLALQACIWEGVTVYNGVYGSSKAGQNPLDYFGSSAVHSPFTPVYELDELRSICSDQPLANPAPRNFRQNGWPSQSVLVLRRGTRVPALNTGRSWAYSWTKTEQKVGRNSEVKVESVYQSLWPKAVLNLFPPPRPNGNSGGAYGYLNIDWLVKTTAELNLL